VLRELIREKKNQTNKRKTNVWQLI